MSIEETEAQKIIQKALQDDIRNGRSEVKDYELKDIGSSSSRTHRFRKYNCLTCNKEISERERYEHQSKLKHQVVKIRRSGGSHGKGRQLR